MCRILMVATLATCLIGFADRAAGQISASKPAEEAKGIRLPKPGERVLFQVRPDRGLPGMLSSAQPPTPMEPDSLLPEEEDPEAAATPPSNDNCATALVINGIGSFNFNNSMATTDGNPHFACNFFGQPQIEKDVWFKWTAPVTARFVAETCGGTSVDTKIVVYNTTNCTPSGSTGLILGCNDDACSVQSRVGFNATAGQRYLVRVGSYPGLPGGAGVLRMAYEAGQTICTYPPQNCQARNNSDAFDSTGHIMYDDFTVQTHGFINGLCFWGSYYNGVGDCQTTSADQFRITYYYNVAGSSPEGNILQEFFPGQYQIIGPIATGAVIANGFPEYAYTITHPSIEFYPDECFWVSIENELPPPPEGNCSWYWEKGAGGNTIAYRDSVRIDEDMAFCLSVALDPPSQCQQAAPPANDTCANAEQVYCGTVSDNIDNLFGTTSLNDPSFSCRYDGPAQGYGTFWFRFTASATSARVSLCANQGGDTLLGIYSGTCGNLTEIACNDDLCGFKSQVCATGLTVGQTYYIQVGSYDDASRGSYFITVDCPCPPPPANDNCSGATLVNIPSNTFSSTVNATVDSSVPTCGFSLVNAQGVWYRVVGNGRTLTASLCSGSTSFDTKISVFCGNCGLLTCIAENDDDCGSASQVEWCSENGRTYYILVHGYNGQVGTFFLQMTSDATPCTTFQDCTTCDLVCPLNAIQENEPCGGDANGGCNVSPVVYQIIQCGQTICGSMFTVGAVRDTDWYQFTITAPSVITWSVQSESPIEAILVDTACPPTTISFGTADRCGTAIASAILNPGTYRAFVGAVDDGYPCGSGNDYIAALTCGPVGACCVEGDCTRVTQAVCNSLLGTYAGDATICPITYNASTCSNVFEDIETTGLGAVLADNEGASVPIGFPFKFYGINYTAITISSNGYLTFDGSGGDPTNDPIPSANQPNSLIAPFWDDLSPQQTSTIRYQTLGAAPNRRFIVQWTDLPQFLDTDSNTFQAVLFETTNEVEFRYGDFTPQATPGDYSIGIENQAGVNGTSVDPGTLTLGSCVRFAPMLLPGGCTVVQPCIGDANGDRVVNFADVVAVVTYWGLAGPSGDANGDGAVNFTDVTKVLENWGRTCPL